MEYRKVIKTFRDILLKGYEGDSTILELLGTDDVIDDILRSEAEQFTQPQMSVDKLRQLIDGFYSWSDSLSQSEYDEYSLTSRCEKYFFEILPSQPTTEEKVESMPTNFIGAHGSNFKPTTSEPEQGVIYAQRRILLRDFVRWQIGLDVIDGLTVDYEMAEQYLDALAVIQEPLRKLKESQPTTEESKVVEMSAEEEEIDCGVCWGSGWERQFVTPCRECNGTGKVIAQHREQGKGITLEQAEELAKNTGYFHEAHEPEENPINTADAGAFFLEGYNYAKNKS